MISARTAWTLACFAIAVCLVYLGYTFAYQSGCIFDGKNGYGDFDQAQRLDGFMQLSFLVATVLATAAVSLQMRLKVIGIIAAFVGTLVLMLLVAQFIGFEGAMQGTQVCRP